MRANVRASLVPARVHAPARYRSTRAQPNTTMVECTPRALSALSVFSYSSMKRTPRSGLAQQEILVERGQAIGGRGELVGVGFVGHCHAIRLPRGKINGSAGETLELASPR